MDWLSQGRLGLLVGFGLFQGIVNVIKVGIANLIQLAVKLNCDEQVVDASPAQQQVSLAAWESFQCFWHSFPRKCVTFDVASIGLSQSRENWQSLFTRVVLPAQLTHHCKRAFLAVACASLVMTALDGDGVLWPSIAHNQVYHELRIAL